MRCVSVRLCIHTCVLPLSSTFDCITSTAYEFSGEHVQFLIVGELVSVF